MPNMFWFRASLSFSLFHCNLNIQILNVILWKLNMFFILLVRENFKFEDVTLESENLATWVKN